eukprot:2214110-Pleurochrysis_carterae.AAC.1
MRIAQSRTTLEILRVFSPARGECVPTLQIIVNKKSPVQPTSTRTSDSLNALVASSAPHRLHHFDILRISSNISALADFFAAGSAFAVVLVDVAAPAANLLRRWPPPARVTAGVSTQAARLHALCAPSRLSNVRTSTRNLTSSRPLPTYPASILTAIFACTVAAFNITQAPDGCCAAALL